MAALTRERAVTFPAWSSAWRLDHGRAVNYTVAVFGVQAPLRFTRRRGTGTKWGGWHCWGGDYVHRVHLIVYRGMTLADYLESLAHELRHAWQAEQFGSPDGWSATVRPFLPAETREGSATGGLYAQGDPDGVRQDNPFETDADEAAARLWPTLLPCIRLTKGAR